MNGGEKMKCEICIEKKADAILEYITEKFPSTLRTSILEFLSNKNFPQISEIRLHSNAFVTFIANSMNLKSEIFINSSLLEEVLRSLCGGSEYAHFNTIKEGYISLGNGIRAGICGRATLENGIISGISNITGINIRLPKRIFHSADYLFSLLKKHDFEKSIIIYSKPGVGKTTILRELIYLISLLESPIRHAIIDSREEITPFMDECLLSSDVFISYPKGLAIEIATKTMTPELIICDEISSYEEAMAILMASCSGVKLIATTHASSFEELLRKENIKELLSHNVFDFALGVSRERGSKKYIFTLDEL